MNKLVKYFRIIVVVILSFLLIIFPKDIAESAVLGIENCINIIIPSMFAFMVISTYIMSSNIYEIIFTPLFVIFNHIIRLNKSLFSVFCLSLIGGYPIGIKLLKELIAQNKNYSEISAVMSGFCYCISPTFAITMIGLGLYGNAEVGLIIYISNVIACIIMAIIQSHRNNLKVSDINISKKGGIIYSINSSANALYKICSIIIIFNIMLTAIESLLLVFQAKIPIIIKSFIEISNVVNLSNPNMASLPIISALSSTGGLCVLFQSYSLIGDDFSPTVFLISRLPCALISYLTTIIMLLFWDISIPAFSENQNYMFELNTNRIILVLVLIMCVILLQKNEKNLKKG